MQNFRAVGAPPPHPQPPPHCEFLAKRLQSVLHLFFNFFFMKLVIKIAWKSFFAPDCSNFFQKDIAFDHLLGAKKKKKTTTLVSQLVFKSSCTNVNRLIWMYCIPQVIAYLITMVGRSQQKIATMMSILLSIVQKIEWVDGGLEIVNIPIWMDSIAMFQVVVQMV